MKLIKIVLLIITLASVAIVIAIMKPRKIVDLYEGEPLGI